MRRIVLFTAACGLLPSIAAAQQCAAPSYAPQCAAPAMAAPAPATAPPRNFVRAPATGQAAGESNSIGLRGFTLHIPEMRIGLPTLELPSLMRFRREAEMIFDHTRGPLVNGDVLDFGNLPANAAPAVAPAVAPAFAPTCIPQSPACAAPGVLGKTDAANETIEARMARLEGLERELASLRQQMAQVATPGSNGAGKRAGMSTVTGSRPVSRPVITQARHQDAEEQTNEVEQVPNAGLSSPTESTPVPERVSLTSRITNKLLRK